MVHNRFVTQHTQASDSPAGPEPAEPARRSPGARLLRFVVWSAVALLLLAAGLVWLAARPETLAWAAQHASRLTDGRLAVEGVTGSLFRELTARSVRWQDGHVVVTVDMPRIAYQPLALLDGRVVVEYASAARVTVDLPAAGQAAQMLPLPPALAALLPVTIHWLEVGEVSIRRAGAQTVMLEGVEAALRHDGDRVQVNPLRVDVTAAGSRVTVRGDASTFARAPYATDGRFVLQLPGAKQPLRVDVRVNGPIETLAVRASTLLAGAPIEARSELRAFDPRPLRRVRLEVKDLDLASLDRSLPVTRLAGTYDAEVMPAWASEPRPMLIGPLALANTVPGTLDDDRLPVAAAKAVVGYSEGRIQVQDLQASGPLGDVAGDAWVMPATGGPGEPPTFHLALASAALHLKGLDGRLAPRTMKARLEVDPGDRRGGGRSARVRLEASDATLVASLQAELAGDRLRIERAQVAAPGSAGIRTQLAGQVGIAAPWPVALAGDFRDFDPSQLLATPAGRLSGTWRLDGHFADAAGGRLRAEVALASSRLRGLALAGEAAATIALDAGRARRVSAVDIRLDWGASTIAATGALGQADDMLRIVLSSRQAGELLDNIAGQLDVRADLRGTLRAPSIQASVEARRMKVAARGMRAVIPAAAIEVSSERPRSGFAHVKARLDDVALMRIDEDAVLRLGRVTADVAGTRRHHVGTVRAEGAERGLLLEARGGVDGDGAWLGTVEKLQASHPWLRPAGAGAGAAGAPVRDGDAPDLRALQPFLLEVGSDRAVVRNARIEYRGAQVSLRAADLRGSALSLRADATGVGAEWLARIVAAGVDARPSADRGEAVRGGAAPLPGLGPDLRLTVAVEFDGDLADASAADWKGTVLLRRESGDLVLPMGQGGEVARAGLESLVASATIDARALGMVLDVAGTNIGRIGMEARARLVPGDEPVWSSAALARSPLDGRLDVATSAVGWVAPLPGASWQVDGALGARLRLAGTLARPRADGVVTGSGLTATEPAMGLRLANGVLAAEFAGDRIDVKLLRFESGEGSVAVSGQLQAPPGPLASETRIVLDRLAIPLGPGQGVILSGSTVASLREGALSLTGRLVAEEGTIALGGQGAGDPGVLPLAEGPAGPRTNAAVEAGAAAPSARTQAALALELDLGSRFRVVGEGLETRMVGSLQMQGDLTQAPAASGTLTLVEGGWELPGRRLRIAHGRVMFDGPFDDPALDIVAVRDSVKSRPGVAVTGTASAPVVTLLPGEPAQADAQRLARLVLGASPAQAKEAERMLGDAGGRLGPRLMDAWQRSLRGIWEVLRLQYELADRLSLRVQVGSEGAAELLGLFPLD